MSPASPGSPRATVSVTVTTAGSSVALTKGQTLQVVVPSQNPKETTKFDVLPAGSAVLTRVPGASGVFVAAGGGTAQVMVTQTPVCSPGDECPAHIVNLGTVNVTVTG